MLCKMSPLRFRPEEKYSVTIQEVAPLILYKLRKIIRLTSVYQVTSVSNITALMNCEFSGLPWHALLPSNEPHKCGQETVAFGLCPQERTAVSGWVNVPVLIPGTTAIENELPKPAQQRIRHLCSASRPQQLIGRAADGC